MIALKRILVATDFGKPAEAALTYGRDFARTFGAQLLVLHVADYLAGRYPIDTYPGGFVELQADIEKDALKHLHSIVSSEDVQQLRAQAVVRSSNTPAATITAYAKQEGVDLIVIGTHGRAAVPHSIMGSVAERVVRTAPCPVLTIRHPEHDFLAPDALIKAGTA
jgi:nucleotide-binding universal stress UspA family protein